MRRYLICCLLIACTTSPDEDGRDDRFTDSSGKADTGGITDGSPDAIAVLNVANTTSSEVLREAAPDGVGLSDRTVDALLDLRLGDDGVPGTADDGHFDTLAQLDAVPYIGPVAFKKFLAYAKAHPQPIRITVGVSNVAQVVYRDGDKPWAAADKASDGNYSFDVHGPYSMATVCVYTNFVSVQQTAATPQDGTSRGMSCGTDSISTPPPPTVKVTGQVAHAGTVTLGYTQGQSAVDGWPLSLDVQPGTYDLIATSATHVLVRRDIAVTDNTALAAIDQTAGATLEHVPFSLNTVAGEQAYAYVSLDTAAAGATIYSGDPAGVLMPPAGFTQSTDSVLVQTSTYGINTGRYRSVFYHPGDSTSLTLPDPLEVPNLEASGHAIEMSWSSLPDAQYYNATLGQSSVSYSATLTKSYLDATHATRISFPTDAPGILPAWQIDTTKPYSGSISVYTYETSSTGSTPYGAWATRTVNGASPRSQETALDQLARDRAAFLRPR